jgi:pyridoxamine 5'-phosphate oxidase
MPSPPRLARRRTQDPVAHLVRWLRKARRAGVHEPDAMTLATANRAGRPSARMVLLRGLDARGLTFFTNYRSRKGADLAANPRAAAVFYWPVLGCQVRVEGRVTRLAPEDSDRYFASRPRQARLAAAASDQSRPIRDRATLLARYRVLARRYAGGEVPRPPHWGGFRLSPDAIEFWRSRPYRLHDRIRYERGARAWKTVRLAP